MLFIIANTTKGKQGFTQKNFISRYGKFSFNNGQLQKLDLSRFTRWIYADWFDIKTGSYQSR